MALTDLDPDTVTVLARCEGDDAARPVRSEEPVLAGFPVPLEVRLGHDGLPALGDGLQSTPGERRGNRSARTPGRRKDEPHLVPPVAPGTVSVESPDATGAPATFRVVVMEELNRPELVVLPNQPCMLATIDTRALCVFRTYTILTPETCAFLSLPGRDRTVRTGGRHRRERHRSRRLSGSGAGRRHHARRMPSSTSAAAESQRGRPPRLRLHFHAQPLRLAGQWLKSP